MIHHAVKVRIYPSSQQVITLAQHFGSARWWWNYALNKCIETYKETGKGLTRSAMNSMLPKLKKEEETKWLKDCYSQVLQSVSLNLSRAYLNFFTGRAKYPRFKSQFQKQSIQYSQQVKQIGASLKFPGRLGRVNAKIHRPLDGEIKTVTVSMTPSGKYYASVLLEIEADAPKAISHDTTTYNSEGKIIGIDLGIKDFAITYDGHKTSKYGNPRHLLKHEKNLKRKQQKLARKQKGSNKRSKARRLAAKVYERISNVRQDFLHKLSRKIVNNNQVVVTENHLARSLASYADAVKQSVAEVPSVVGTAVREAFPKEIPFRGSLVNVKGMVRNRKLASSISDCSWGKFINFLDYKLSQSGKLLVEIDRFFPSSKTCSNCHYKIDKLLLDIRSWTCPSCQTRHDRDENAAKKKH